MTKRWCHPTGLVEIVEVLEQASAPDTDHIRLVRGPLGQSSQSVVVRFVGGCRPEIRTAQPFPDLDHNWGIPDDRDDLVDEFVDQYSVPYGVAKTPGVRADFQFSGSGHRCRVGPGR